MSEALVNTENTASDLIVGELKLRLLGGQIQPFLSSYLMNGFRLDSFQIESVDVSNGSIVALCHVPTFYPSEMTTNAFSLSFNGAVKLAAQVGAIHAGVLNQQSKIEVEPKISKLSLEMKKPVIDPKNILVRMEVTESHVKMAEDRKGWVEASYTWKLDLAEGSILGEATLQFTMRIL